MSAEPAQNESTFEEVIEVLEPHASVIKLGLALFAFAFVGVCVFKAQIVNATLPSSTTGRDIGTTTVGSTLYSGESSVGSNYDIRGNGSDIWGTSDSFRYVYFPAPSGDFEFVSKIDYVENDNSWTKGGLMVRASTASNSPYLFVFSTPGANGVNVQARSLTGSSSYVVGTSAVTTFPKWVKLKRAGGFLTAYVSTNGSTFTQVGGSSIINLGSSPLLGMAVTSHTYGNLSLVKFRDVKLVVASSTVQPPVPPLPASSNIDDDGDGFSNNAEGWIGTDRSAACPTNSTHKAWPPDMNNDGAVTMADIDIVKNPAWFNSAWGDGRFQARYDLYVDGKINVQDITAFVAPVRYLDKRCGSQSTPPAADLRPDLKVTNLSLSSTSVTANQAVTATVSVQNRGLKLSPCGGYGDVDMNGGINYTDSQLILRYTAGETTLLSGEKLVRANVNGGVINSTDALEVMRFYEGQLTTFQAVCGTAVSPTQPVTGTFNYRFSNTSAIPPTCALNWDGQFAGMKAGEIRTVSFPFTAPSTAGSYKASMFIDNTCRVAEINEGSDNITNVDYTVNPQPGGVQLKINEVNEDGTGYFQKYIDGAFVALTNTSNQIVASGFSANGGNVKFENITPGNYVLFAYKTGYKGVWRQNGAGIGSGCSSTASVTTAGVAYSVNVDGVTLTAARDDGVKITSGQIALCRDLGLAKIPVAVQPGPSQQAICPGQCTKEMIRAYVNNVVPEPYRSTIHIMLDKESDGGDWGALANNGSDCPTNDPCHGVVQFKIGTWNSARDYSGGTWVNGDVYPDFVSVWDLRGAYPDNNVWNPFGQINVAYQYLRNCWYTHWPWMPRPSYCAAPGVPL